MRIEFRKVTREPKPFSFEKENVCLKGSLKLLSGGFVEMNMELTGELELPCDRCAETVVRTLHETIRLKASDGVYNGESDETIDIIEFYDGWIDVDEVLESELSLLRSDYYICDACHDLEIDSE